jgi:surfeit locus 1 family protein
VREQAWLVSPRLLGAHLLLLAALAVAGGLGLWQYGSWQDQRAAEAADLTETAPRPLADVLGPDDPFPQAVVGQPVTFSGTWLPEGTVLVSGRSRDDVEGYWVVTPLTTGGADAAAVPVVRGWTASTDDVPPAPSGRGEVTGWLQPSEGTGAPDDDPTDDVFPQLRVADLVQRVDVDLYNAYAVAEQPEDGLDPADLEQLPDVGRFTALRNLLYALEWWVFAGFAVFIWWRFVQDSRPGATPPDGAVTDDDRVASGA